MSGLSKDEVTCRSCGFVACVSEYVPSFSVYNEIRCPKCGSTNNEHNTKYQLRLSEAMKS